MPETHKRSLIRSPCGPIERVVVREGTVAISDSTFSLNTSEVRHRDTDPRRAGACFVESMGPDANGVVIVRSFALLFAFELIALSGEEPSPNRSAADADDSGTLTHA